MKASQRARLRAYLHSLNDQQLDRVENIAWSAAAITAISRSSTPPLVALLAIFSFVALCNVLPWYVAVMGGCLVVTYTLMILYWWKALIRKTMLVRRR